MTLVTHELKTERWEKVYTVDHEHIALLCETSATGEGSVRRTSCMVYTPDGTHYLDYFMDSRDGASDARQQALNWIERTLA